MPSSISAQYTAIAELQGRQWQVSASSADAQIEAALATWPFLHGLKSSRGLKPSGRRGT